jgi:hypothetical protein
LEIFGSLAKTTSTVVPQFAVIARLAPPAVAIHLAGWLVARFARSSQ